MTWEGHNRALFRKQILAKKMSQENSTLLSSTHSYIFIFGDPKTTRSVTGELQADIYTLRSHSRLCHPTYLAPIPLQPNLGSVSPCRSGEIQLVSSKKANRQDPPYGKYQLNAIVNPRYTLGIRHSTNNQQCHV